VNKREALYLSNIQANKNESQTYPSIEFDSGEEVVRQSLRLDVVGSDVADVHKVTLELEDHLLLVALQLSLEGMKRERMQKKKQTNKQTNKQTGNVIKRNRIKGLGITNRVAYDAGLDVGVRAGDLQHDLGRPCLLHAMQVVHSVGRDVVIRVEDNQSVASTRAHDLERKNE
jgi:hypothetical protein